MRARGAYIITRERGHHGLFLLYQPLVQARCKEREKNFPLMKTGIKTGLFIRTENEIRPTYNMNIP